MRSTKSPTVEVSAIGDTIPPFIGVIHRHFQKSLPTVLDAKEVTLIAPVDLLDLIIPGQLLDRIELIEVHYQRRV